MVACAGTWPQVRRRLLPAVILAMLALTSVCPPAGAQHLDRPALVVVAVVPEPEADSAYAQILREALMVTLARSRMKPVAAATHEEARASGREQKADYLVLGTCRNSTDTLELSVEVWRPGGASAFATGRAAGRIDLAMDAVAAEALAPVLPAMQARFPARAGAAASPSGAGIATAEPSERWRRLELAFGAAPLVTTGTVADYAKIGAFTALELDLRFRAGSGVLSPGLLAGCGWFRASATGVADILVAPLGPALHWTVAAGPGPEVSLHAATGPALIIAITSWADTAAKVSPFVAGGLDVDIGLTPALGLRIEADYLVVFEGSMVLQGFLPRLSLRTTF
jgi:hypothetical protein